MACLSSLVLDRAGLGRNLVLGLKVGGLLLVFGFTSGLLLESLVRRFLGENPFEVFFKDIVLKAPIGFLLLAGVLAPISEEVYFRGYAYAGFKNKFGTLGAVVLSYLFFPSVHLNPWNLIELTVAGALFAALFQKTGNLVSPIVAHATNNVTFTVLVLLGY